MPAPKLKFKKGIAKDPETGRWHVRVMVNGERVRRILTSRREAEALIAGMKRKKLAAQLGLAVVGSGPTLGTCVDNYIEAAEARGIAPKTAANYRRIGRRAKRILGARKQAWLNNHDIAEFVRTRRADNASKTTIEGELFVLRAMLRDGAGWAAITWAMPRLIDQNENAPKPIPTDDEIAALCLAVSDHPPIYRAVLLGILTAMRVGDICTLTSNEVHDGVIVTGMHKRRGRQIAVPMVATLAEALEGIEGPLALPAYGLRSGLRWHTRHLSDPWNGISILRSTAATWASEAGFTDESVGVLLGHQVHTVARKHYIRSRLPLRDPFIETRREMLETIEARLLVALKGGQKVVKNLSRSGTLVSCQQSSVG